MGKREHDAIRAKARLVMNAGESMSDAFFRIKFNIERLSRDLEMVRTISRCKEQMREAIFDLKYRSSPNLLPLVDRKGPIEWPSDPASLLIWMFSDKLIEAIDKELDVIIGTPSTSAKEEDLVEALALTKAQMQAITACDHLPSKIKTREAWRVKWRDAELHMIDQDFGSEQEADAFIEKNF